MATMQRAIKVLTLIVASILVGACHEGFSDDTTNNNNNQIPQDDTVYMTIVAESHSRTGLAIYGSNVNWLEGDRIVVIENGCSHTTSTGATIDDSGRARFDVSFAKREDSNGFTYNAIYPAEHTSFDEGVNIECVKVTLPAQQHATTASFDPKADILVAKRTTSSTQPTEINIRFERLVAIGAIILEDMPSKSKISSLTI